jgi:RND family efflux transporter MFP subunit
MALMRRWIYIIIPLAVVILVVWRLLARESESRTQAEQRAAQLKAAPVVTAAIARPRVISQVLEAISTIESPHAVNVAAKITGKIIFLNVREGYRISRGQVLVRIDPTQAQSVVRQAQGALAEAQHRLVQAQLTQNPNNVSVSTQIQQQRAAVAGAEADYNQASRNYKRQVASADAALRDADFRVASAKASVAVTQANLWDATAKYKRTYQLYEQGFVAAQDVDDAKAAMEVQQSTLDTVKGQLSSAAAQKRSAEEQLNITKTTGRANIEDAQAKLTQAKSALTFAVSNRAQVPAYVQNITALKATVAQAKASLRNAESQLSDTILTSPLDGYVTARYMDPGAVATPGASILTVQSLQTVWATAAVSEEMSREVRLGQPATLSLDASPGVVFHGIVTESNESADLQSRQVRVRVTLKNPGRTIKPGMYGRVAIITNQQRTNTAVPLEALHRDDQGAYVFVIENNGVAFRRPVVAGMSDANFVAISNGLHPGERVITLSVSAIRSGRSVRIGSMVQPTPDYQGAGSQGAQGGSY